MFLSLGQCLVAVLFSIQGPPQILTVDGKCEGSRHLAPQQRDICRTSWLNSTRLHYSAGHVGVLCEFEIEQVLLR
ncbi:hypothetical protein LZ31DRAFT_12054 [Colletotrichum somersetense]|nr:hypothetical protein LZ31DRAFT_12054 [Colletotrichum somersetense]